MPFIKKVLVRSLFGFACIWILFIKLDTVHLSWTHYTRPASAENLTLHIQKCLFWATVYITIDISCKYYFFWRFWGVRGTTYILMGFFQCSKAASGWKYFVLKASRLVDSRSAMPGWRKERRQLLDDKWESRNWLTMNNYCLEKI